jgi:SagB-type dehydrogenase family enzyme
LLGNGEQLEFPFSNLLDGGRNSMATELTLARFSTLLRTVFGVSSHKSLKVTGIHLRKRSPSGGSRHPTEAYVIAFDIPGLAPGAYHYNPASHRLVVLKDGDLKNTYMKEVVGLNRRLSFVPRAAIILTSIVERSMHRYRDSRSYRVLHFDIGHLLQSSQLVARAQGVQCFTAYSLADSKAEAMLGIDGLMETAMAQIILG